jgi:hypothetical protein
MCHLHRGGQEDNKGHLVMQDMLDGIPPELHQEVVHQRRLSSGATTSTRRRDAAPETVAVPRLQLPKRRAAEGPVMLVRKGNGSQVSPWPSALLMRPDMRPTAYSSQAMPAQMFHHVPRWALSSLRLDGTYTALFLWQEIGYAPLLGHGL